MPFINIGVPYNTKFAARDEIVLEEGKSVNLTALLTATGSLPDENRKVTWKVAKISEKIPAGAYTAGIKVTVVKAAPFAEKSKLKVNDQGVRSWHEEPVAGDVYLGFTSDVHFDRTAAAGENLLRLWMESLAQKVPGIDYLGIAGDLTSAYASDIRSAWENIRALMNLADRFKAEGFVKYDNLFFVGNHEHWEIAGGALEQVRGNTAEYPDIQDIIERLFETGEEPIETDSYIIVPFGAEATEEGDTSYGAEYGSGQKFRDESLAALEAYLETAPKDRPIFVVSHYPIHTYGSPEGGDRVTTNSLKLINVLNKYPNVLFVWGHNHSSADPMYDKVYGPGDFIQIGPSIFGETARINFFYMAAGCMSDFEYRSSASSTSLPGGIYVKGKGMLVGISGSDVNIMWYDRPEAEWPAFKLPVELNQLAEAATDRKVWYGAGAYRLNEEITNSDWLYQDMHGSSGWASTGAVLGGGTSVVIFGFKGTELDAIASGITELAGYDRVVSPSNMGPGKWGIVTSQDGTIAFVLLYTVSDGNIWLPKYIGDAQVLSLAGNTITLWDGIDDGDATNWNGSVTWDDIAASITAFGEITTTGTGEAFSPDNADIYTVTANGVVYRVVSGVPEKFVLPVELEALFKTSFPANSYGAWYGYVAALNNSPFSKSAFQNISDLAEYGENIVFVGINQGLLDFAELLSTGMPGYQKTPLSDSSITSASAFAEIKDDFVPGTWFFAASGSASYIILYPDFCLCDEPTPSEVDCTICSNIFCGKVIKGKAHTLDDEGCDVVCADCGVVITPGGGKGHVPNEDNCSVCAECGADLPKSCSVDHPCAFHNVCQCTRCGNCNACLEEECCSAANCDCAEYGECKCFADLPLELQAFVSELEAEYKIWRGYDNFFDKVEADGFDLFGGMMEAGIGGSLGDLRKDVVIVGIKGEGLTSTIADTLYELEIDGYGGKAVAYAKGTAESPEAGEALIKEKSSFPKTF